MTLSTRHRPAIIEHGGALLIDNLVSDELLARLTQECSSRRAGARDQAQALSCNGHWRSANPARHLASADGGEAQISFYNNAALHRQLAHWCGFTIRPTSGCGTYSYYDQPGHFLARHRDVRTCDVTLITCLHRAESRQPSGALRVYPRAVRTPLEKVESASYHHDLHPQRGQSILLLGGCIPHEVLPADTGFQRWISVLCFEMVR